MRFEKSCGAILLRKDTDCDRVMIIRHKNGGHWSFPKGHVEKGETETETAIREIKEETGYDAIIDTGFRETVTFSPYEGTMKDVVYFAGEIASGSETAQEAEVLDIKFCCFEEAMEYITYDNDKELLRKFIAYVNKK